MKRPDPLRPQNGIFLVFYIHMTIVFGLRCFLILSSTSGPVLGRVWRGGCVEREKCMACPSMTNNQASHMKEIRQFNKEVLITLCSMCKAA